VLTTTQGVPVSDEQNTLRAGPSGPAPMEDFSFREKMFHFDHERIPERVVHARGFGVHGHFESNGSLASASRAAVFGNGEKTPVFVRFSTVAGGKGSMDLARDVRGFATTFDTKEGNWDLVGNNIPVFFIQDPVKFPDMVHAFKPEPGRGFPQSQTAHDNAWDFISLTPGSMHMIMWVMSDGAMPRSFRFMEGFGVHTFRLVTADGKSTFVTFHWKPKQGLQSVVWSEAVKINGADPDFHRRDLWEAIGNGDLPEWERRPVQTTRRVQFDFWSRTVRKDFTNRPRQKPTVILLLGQEGRVQKSPPAMRLAARPTERPTRDMNIC
jgi:catalase